ncbi:MAG: hypothetical protein RLZZ413_2922 [Pseudomonadota bacterium]
MASAATDCRPQSPGRSDAAPVTADRIKTGCRPGSLSSCLDQQDGLRTPPLQRAGSGRSARPSGPSVCRYRSGGPSRARRLSPRHAQRGWHDPRSGSPTTGDGPCPRTPWKQGTLRLKPPIKGSNPSIRSAPDRPVFGPASRPALPCLAPAASRAMADKVSQAPGIGSRLAAGHPGPHLLSAVPDSGLRAISINETVIYQRNYRCRTQAGQPGPQGPLPVWPARRPRG